MQSPDENVLRVVIADDEPAARDKLRRLLEAQPGVELVGAASNGAEAARCIVSLAPDVVLLDIRMPEMDGFAVLEQTKRKTLKPFHTVFVTAYDEYAIRAFGVRALDYLLKPFDAARLGEALARAREVVARGAHDGERVRHVLEQLRAPTSQAELDDEPPGYLTRICIKSIGRMQIVRVAEVEWIEAYGNYVRLHTADDHPLARNTLRSLEERLDPSTFCRTHRGAIVNLTKIRDMRPTVSGDYVIRLESGVRLRLSRGYRAELLRRMER